MFAVLAGHVLVAGVLLGVPGLGRWGMRAAALLAATSFGWLAASAGSVLDGSTRSEALSWVSDLGLTLDLVLDPLGLAMSLLVTGVGIAVFVFGSRYMGDDGESTRLAALLVLFAAAMLGLVWSDRTCSACSCSGRPPRWCRSSSSASPTGAADGPGRGVAGPARHRRRGPGPAGRVGPARRGPGDLDASRSLPPTRRRQVGGRPWPRWRVLLGAFTKSAQVPSHGWLLGAMAASDAGVVLPALGDHGDRRRLAGAPPRPGLRRRRLVVSGAAGGRWRLGPVGRVAGPERGRPQAAARLLHDLRAGSDVRRHRHRAPPSRCSPRLAVLGGTRPLQGRPVHGRRHDRPPVRHPGPPRDRWAAAESCPTTALAMGLAALSMAAVPATAGFVAKEAAVVAGVDAGHGVGLGRVSAVIAASGVLAVAYALAPVGRDVPRTSAPAASRSAPPPPPVGARRGARPARGCCSGVVPAASSELVAGAAGSVHDEGRCLRPGCVARRGAPPWPSRWACSPRGAVLAATLDGDALDPPEPRRCGSTSSWPGCSDAPTASPRCIQPGSLPGYVAVISRWPWCRPRSLVLAGGLRLARATPCWRRADGPGLVAVLVVSAAVGRGRLRQPHRRRSWRSGRWATAWPALFWVQGAPDLALTQVLVETVVVAAFVLVFRRLPARFAPAGRTPGRSRAGPPRRSSAAVAAAVLGAGRRHRRPADGSGATTDRTASSTTPSPSAAAATW